MRLKEVESRSAVDKINDIRRSFQATLLLHRNGENLALFPLAQGTTQNFLDLVEELKRSDKETELYLDMLFKRRLPEFFPQAHQFLKIKKISPAQEPLISDYVDLLDESITLLHQQLHLIHSIHFPWYKTNFLSDARVRRGLVAAAAFALLVLVGRWAISRNRGLKAQYFSDVYLSQPLVSRTDKEINFPNIPSFNLDRREKFSVRWTGTLNVPATGGYEFTAISDDGVRLKIDERTVIENWSIHGAQEDKGSVELAQGDHLITVEYFQNEGDGRMQLFWRKSSESDKKLIHWKFLKP